MIKKVLVTCAVSACVVVGVATPAVAGGRAQFAQDGADIRATADVNGRIIGTGNIDDEVGLPLLRVVRAPADRAGEGAVQRGDVAAHRLHPRCHGLV